MPAGIEPEDVAGVVDGAPQLSGNTATIASADPQRDLYALLGWAHERDVQLDDLEVRKPSLEDVFLDLTASPDKVTAR